MKEEAPSSRNISEPIPETRCSNPPFPSRIKTMYFWLLTIVSNYVLENFARPLSLRNRPLIKGVLPRLFLRGFVVNVSKFLCNYRKLNPAAELSCRQCGMDYERLGNFIAFDNME